MLSEVLLHGDTPHDILENRVIILPTAEGRSGKSERGIYLKIGKEFVGYILKP